MLLRRLAFLLLLPVVMLIAAEKKAPAPAPEIAGAYAGRWSADEGEATGELELTLRRDAQAAWVGEASFTFEGARVPTKMRSTKVEGAKIVLVFDWRIEGSPGESTVTGELAGDVFSGVYETRTSDGSTRGKWTVKRVPAPAAKAG